MTKRESERRAKITGLSTIKYWIEHDLITEMPIPNNQPISCVKIPFLWSLYYLRKGLTYEEAIEDIILKGGDSMNNAAIIGGLIGATKGIDTGNINYVENTYELLL